MIQELKNIKPTCPFAEMEFGPEQAPDGKGVSISLTLILIPGKESLYIGYKMSKELYKERFINDFDDDDDDVDYQRVYMQLSGDQLRGLKKLLGEMEL